MVVQDKDEKSGGKPIGSFEIKGGDKKGLPCNGDNSGITHTNSFEKAQVLANWSGPAGQKVVVRATVVYEYNQGDHVRAEATA